jgi:pentatricopeptide repeat protein
MKEVFELFEEMIEKDHIVPDQLTYNVIIDGFCRLGQVEKARTIFGFMRKNECEPNAFNYATLMNGLRERDDLHEERRGGDARGRAGATRGEPSRAEAGRGGARGARRGGGAGRWRQSSAAVP